MGEPKWCASHREGTVWCGACGYKPQDHVARLESENAELRRVLEAVRAYDARVGDSLTNDLRAQVREALDAKR